MAKEDVEIVRRLFEYGADAKARADRRDGSLTADHPFFMIWHPECVLEELPEMPDAAAYHGRAGVARYFAHIPELWEELTFTPAEVLDAPDGVVAVTDISGRSKAGVDAQLRVYQVFRLRDGMIASVSAYSDRGQAFAAAGLPK